VGNLKISKNIQQPKGHAKSLSQVSIVKQMNVNCEGARPLHSWRELAPGVLLPPSSFSPPTTTQLREEGEIQFSEDEREKGMADLLKGASCCQRNSFKKKKRKEER